MNYETGDVPQHQCDVINKCEQCGEVWVGPAAAICGDCAYEGCRTDASEKTEWV